MADIDDGLDKAFEGFGEDEGTPPAAPATPPAVDPNNPTPPAPAAAEPPKEEPKKDEEKPAETPPADDKKETPPPADPEKKPEEGAEPPKAPETPPAPPEEPKPLTKEDVTSIIQNVRTEERNSGVALQQTTQEVLDAYYPEGLSNTLIDQASGKPLVTPQDVVNASNGQMSMEDAAQWLMNEQFKLDSDVAKIKKDAERIAETTLNFKRDSQTVLVKYEPLFKWQPSLQKKAFDLLMKNVKSDVEKGVVLSAPDVMDLYDTYLEPYQKAYEYSQGQSATNPVPPATPPAPTPGTDDRLDEGGDGGSSPVNDPNDFGQQVSKELAKGM